MIELALDIAKKAHTGQKDKGGNNYIEHPLYVASQVKKEDEKIVALLHDVCEDSDITLDNLRDYGFDDKIVNAVNAITKRKTDDYTSYISRVKNNPIALAVKKADLMHNSDISRIPNPTEKDYKRVKKYQEILDELNSTKY